MTLKFFSGLTIAGITCSLAVMSAAPTQAARIKFEFPTTQGGSGSFILNTDAPLSGVAPLSDAITGQVISEGLGYVNAISNFSYSVPGLDLEALLNTDLTNVKGDFAVYPELPLGSGSFSTVLLPSRCSITSDLNCTFAFSLLYQGNLADLPRLSSNPEQYRFGIAEGYSPTGDVVFQAFVNGSVTRTVVPEPGLAVGLLVASAFGLKSLKKQRQQAT